MIVDVVADYNADPTGAADSTNAFKNAVAYLNTLGGKPVQFRIPAGNYKLTTINQILNFPSNCAIVGDGMEAVEVYYPSKQSGAPVRLFSSVSGKENISMRGVHVKGDHGAGGDYAQTGHYPVYFQGVKGLCIEDVKVTCSRAMGIVTRACDGVVVDGCWVEFCARDGINTADCSNVSVTNNTVQYVDDDSIAHHTQTYTKLDKGVVITGNNVRFAQGIKVLGAKTVTITGNTVEYFMGQGISCQSAPDTGDFEGINASNGVTITGNTVKNPIDRRYVDNLNQTAPYIVIGGPAGQKGSLAAIPGENDPATGNIIDLYQYFENAKSSTTPSGQPIPGNYNIIVANNTCVRDMAPVSPISNLGYGQFYVRSGPENPNITSTYLRQPGIIFAEGILKNALVEGNTFMGCAQAGAVLGGTKLVNVSFKNNKAFDCTNGITFDAANTNHHAFYVEGNTFDLDPLHLSSNRASNGSWLADGGVTGILMQNAKGVIAKGNVFKNLTRISDKGANSNSEAQGQHILFLDNIVECDPAAVGFSTGNKGVGKLPQVQGFLYRIMECDPNSASYGNVKNNCPTAGTVRPTTGRYVAGHVMRNLTPSVQGAAGEQYTLTGWIRLTTGATHTLGTDWAEMRSLTGT